MHLIIKKDGQTVSEFRSAGEPVRIGRRSNNQIALPDSKISKHHTLISVGEGGKWMVEDLGSANKTYLNDQPIEKAQLKTGDFIHIGDFTIEVNLEDKTKAKEPAKEPIKEPAKEPVGTKSGMSAMLSRDQQIVVRKIGADRSPVVTLPAQRLVDYLQATEAIDKVNNLDGLLTVLLDIMARQFNTYHAWCALRGQPTGEMALLKGRQRDGRPVDLKEILLGDKTNQSIEKSEFLLFIFSRDLSVEKDKQVRSMIIAPVLSLAGCFGVLYANNTFRQEHYNLADLDYLMLIAIHAANAIKKF